MAARSGAAGAAAGTGAVPVTTSVVRPHAGPGPVEEGAADTPHTLVASTRHAHARVRLYQAWPSSGVHFWCGGRVVSGSPKALLPSLVIAGYVVACAVAFFASTVPNLRMSTAALLQRASVATDGRAQGAGSAECAAGGCATCWWSGVVAFTALGVSLVRVVFSDPGVIPPHPSVLRWPQHQHQHQHQRVVQHQPLVQHQRQRRSPFGRAAEQCCERVCLGAKAPPPGQDSGSASQSLSAEAVEAIRRAATAAPGAPPHGVWCYRCRIVRPPDAAHCDLCGCCVAAEDHHCGWVGHCIGLGNRKWFVALLASGAVAATTATACAMRSALHVMDAFSERQLPFSSFVDAARGAWVATFVVAGVWALTLVCGSRMGPMGSVFKLVAPLVVGAVATSAYAHSAPSGSLNVPAWLLVSAAAALAPVLALSAAMYVITAWQGGEYEATRWKSRGKGRRGVNGRDNAGGAAAAASPDGGNGAGTASARDDGSDGDSPVGNDSGSDPGAGPGRSVPSPGSPRSSCRCGRGSGWHNLWLYFGACPALPLRARAMVTPALAAEAQAEAAQAPVAVAVAVRATVPTNVRDLAEGLN